MACAGAAAESLRRRFFAAAPFAHRFIMLACFAEQVAHAVCVLGAVIVGPTDVRDVSRVEDAAHLALDESAGVVEHMGDLAAVRRVSED